MTTNKPDISALPAQALKSLRDPVTLYPLGKICKRPYDSNLTLVINVPTRLMYYLDNAKKQYRISLNTTDYDVAHVRAEGHAKELHRIFASSDLKRVYATMEYLS